MYIHPNLHASELSISGMGLFARAYISKNTVIFSGINDSYWHLTSSDILSLNNTERELYLRYAVQIDDDKWVGPIYPKPEDVSVYTNHSCDPNAWFVSEYTLVALCNILPNQEITYDYSTTDTFMFRDTFTPIPCTCQSKLCRGQIDPSYWMYAEPNYAFLPYIQKKIKSRLR
jgi:SET domain-containing protein